MKKMHLAREQNYTINLTLHFKSVVSVYLYIISRENVELEESKCAQMCELAHLFHTSCGFAEPRLD